MRIERNIDINALLEKVFKIVDNPKLAPTWNIGVSELEVISEGKYNIKSTVGDFEYIRTEKVENEKLSARIEGGIFSAMGYIFNSKADKTIVTLWGEFENEKHEKALTKAGEVLLESLKRYVEYLKEGGDPDKYDKKEISVAP